MKLGTMLRDVLRGLFAKPATRLYPTQKRETPALGRGRLMWNPAGCTGCALCVTDCPANAIELIVIDKQAKQFALRYHADRCVFCRQCVQNCRFNCLEMAADQWELASAEPASFVTVYGRLDGATAVSPAAPPASAPAPPPTARAGKPD